MKMQPFKYVMFFLVSVVALLSCDKNDPVPAPTRTVLVYMAADNNLSSNGNTNIVNMMEGLTSASLNNGNLLVYFDPANDVPHLYQISINKQGEAEKQVIKTYEEQNSASGEVVSEIINDVLTDARFDADSYGLMLWSHGTAWLPQNYSNMLKSFGVDKGHWMEIPELAAAIPDHVFDFIIFDACYMASVEVAYELRNKTEYIVASPTEILASGFPYDLIMSSLFKKEADMVAVCEDFFNYYNQQSDLYRSATIALIHTPQLGDLCTATRAILKGKEADVKAMPVSNIQPLDLLTSKRMLYDFGDFIANIATESEYNAFSTAMNKAILYKKTTPFSTYGTGSTMEMKRFSGLNSYIPRAAFNDLNEWYTQLEWYKAVYE